MKQIIVVIFFVILIFVMFVFNKSDIEHMTNVESNQTIVSLINNQYAYIKNLTTQISKVSGNTKAKDINGGFVRVKNFIFPKTERIFKGPIGNMGQAQTLYMDRFIGPGMAECGSDEYISSLQLMPSGDWNNMYMETKCVKIGS